MGCKQSGNVQTTRPTNSLWNDDDKSRPRAEMSFKLQKSVTVNPKNLAKSVSKPHNQVDVDAESSTKLTDKIDLEAELEKLTPDMVKDKLIKKVDDGNSAGLLLTTLEDVEYGIEWKNNELKVVSIRKLDEKIVKKTEIYYDDLHQFLLAESKLYA